MLFLDKNACYQLLDCLGVFYSTFFNQPFRHPCKYQRQLLGLALWKRYSEKIHKINSKGLLMNTFWSQCYRFSPGVGENLKFSITGVFLWVFRNFTEQVFWRTPVDTCDVSYTMFSLTHFIPVLHFIYTMFPLYRIGFYNVVKTIRYNGNRIWHTTLYNITCLY